jgi:hypothetical protein
MDKGLLYLVSLFTGLLIGLAFYGHWRPLLAERWRGLVLILPGILVSASPFILWQINPGWIISSDRIILTALISLRSMIWIFFLSLNLLPRRLFSKTEKPGLTWVQKLFVCPVVLGLVGEAAVLVLNHGTWPVPEPILVHAVTPAMAAGIRNQAYLFLRVIDESTCLPWLGQVWYVPLLSRMHFSTLPTISPAEALTAAGLFGIGISQFFVPRDHRTKRVKRKSRSVRPGT